ncbi:MAG TPA: hypothetical protein P5056_01820 [Candidatus Paceibacterota bacterium]|nr:hypothetical protein [Candidatus Paceibacterota bacterium]
MRKLLYASGELGHLRREHRALGTLGGKLAFAFTESLRQFHDLRTVIVDDLVLHDDNLDGRLLGSPASIFLEEFVQLIEEFAESITFAHFSLFLSRALGARYYYFKRPNSLKRAIKNAPLVEMATARIVPL